MQSTVLTSPENRDLLRYKQQQFALRNEKALAGRGRGHGRGRAATTRTTQPPTKRKKTAMKPSSSSSSNKDEDFCTYHFAIIQSHVIYMSKREVILQKNINALIKI